MGALKDKVLDELFKNNYEELYNQIDKLESDIDVANYINSSKKYFDQTMSSKDLEGMPTFNKALTGKLRTGKVDYDKEFGKDWYNNFEGISRHDINSVAELQGVDPVELTYQMADEATKRRQQDISLGKDGGKLKRVAGFVTNMVRPRFTEAVARGEDPTAKDNVGDILQNALYVTPWGGAARGLGATSRVAGALIRGAASNATNPILTEAYDTAVYDGENNPRGNFSVADVAGGTATNIITPQLLRSLIGRTGRYIPSARKFNEFGGGSTAKEIAEDEFDKYMKVTLNKANTSKLTVPQRKVVNQVESLHRDNNNIYGVLTGKTTIGGRPEGSEYANIKAIVGSEGKNIGEKVDNYLKSRLFGHHSYIADNGRIFNADTPDNLIEMLKNNKVQVPNDLKLYSKNQSKSYSPVSKTIMDYYDGSPAALTSEMANTGGQIAKEEAIKNYITNNLGDKLAEEGMIYTRIPLVGPLIQRYANEQEKEEQDKALQEEILNELSDKYEMPDYWHKYNDSTIYNRLNKSN